MIQVKNYFIPLPGYKCMTVWPFMFVRKASGISGKVTEVDLTHEGIHGNQQKEMFILPFFVWYLAEWIIRLIVYRSGWEAYRNISFEQEAFLNERNPDYLESRRAFAWVKYLIRKSYKR